MKFLLCVVDTELKSRIAAACALMGADAIQKTLPELLKKPLQSGQWLITDLDTASLRQIIAHVRHSRLDPGRMVIRLIDQPWYDYCYHDIPIFASLVRPHDALAASEVICKLAKTRPFEESQSPSQSVSSETLDPLAPCFTRSQPMRALREQILKIAGIAVDTVLLGPTGSGKDTLAQWLHRQSGRSGEFVHLNCAALPDTLFESELFGVTAGAYTGAQKDRPGLLERADQGTLYLDEIDSLSLSSQAKLLTALQYRGACRLGGHRFVASDFRVVASTKQRFEDLVARATFRQDLHFRLSVSTLRIPALAERLEDLLALYSHFLNEAALQYQLVKPELSRIQEEHLLSHIWPGNVRELRAFAQRHVIGLANFDDDKAGGAQGGGLKEQLAAYEQALIEASLRRHGGSVKLASAELQIPVHALYYRLKKTELAESEATSD